MLKQSSLEAVCDEEPTWAGCDEEPTWAGCDEGLTLAGCDEGPTWAGCDEEPSVKGTFLLPPTTCNSCISNMQLAVKVHKK